MDHPELHLVGGVPPLNHAHRQEHGDHKWLHASYTAYAYATID